MSNATTIVELLKSKGFNVQVRDRIVGGITFQYVGIITDDGQMVRGNGRTLYDQANDLAERFSVNTAGLL